MIKTLALIMTQVIASLIILSIEAPLKAMSGGELKTRKEHHENKVAINNTYIINGDNVIINN